jgi:DNA-binding MarR family transcriptional regulator
VHVKCPPAYPYDSRVSDVRWLTDGEQGSWRAFLTSSLLLQDRLNRELNAAHGLTMADYEILVRLSEADQRRMRMTELAQVTLSSKSRLSHQITRMENAGLVRRQECDLDRRGFFAVLTDEGWQRLVEAAPTHVRGVREHLVDQMSPAQFHDLGVSCGLVAGHLQGGSSTTSD